MAKRRRIPQMVHHQPSGQARVRINGRDHYLGKWGSSEAQDRYDELVAELLEERCATEPSSSTTLSTLLAAWWRECKRRYAGGKGPYGNAGNWRTIIRLLRENHGEERAEELGPVKLRKLLENEAERRQWSLTHVKLQLARVKRIYKWAVGEELVSVQSWQRLAAAEIRHGRETQPLPPVDDELVQRTLPHLKPQIRDMVKLQRLTGMRPGELVAMRPEEIERSGDVWEYVPKEHKTKHRGKRRTIYIGPRGQEIVGPYLLRATDYVFPSGRSAKYTSDSYRRAVHRACERHGLPKWSPQQLRKAAATDIRKTLDVEHAASILGHSSATVTGEHYAAADKRRALEAAKLLG